MSSRPFERSRDINKDGNSYRITTVVKEIKEKMKLIHTGDESIRSTALVMLVPKLEGNARSLPYFC